MKIVFYPHKGANRGKEGARWKSGIKWGADFMLDNIAGNAGGHEVVPCYDLDWKNVEDADVVWFHNIATTAYHSFPIVKISPISRWKRKKDRPVIIGGVRGLVGFERSRKILKHFDAVHAGSQELLDKVKPFNENVHIFYPGVDTRLFKPQDRDVGGFTIGWVGDKSKDMKNYEIIEKLGYSYNIASKENYIPHDEMPGFYNGLSVYTHFSSHEGGTRTVLEACSCGVPVVSTDVGAVNQYLDGEWIIPYRDDEEYLVKEFKKRLKRLEDDPELANRVGLANRERVLKFDWSNITKQWIKIIQETIDRVRSSG